MQCSLLCSIWCLGENLCLILYQVVAWLLHHTSFYNDCFRIFPIMLALCSILSATHYAQNYAGIIGLGLPWTNNRAAYNSLPSSLRPDSFPPFSLPSMVKNRILRRHGVSVGYLQVSIKYIFHSVSCQYCAIIHCKTPISIFCCYILK